MAPPYKSLDALPPQYRGGTICIGNFDGVHLGHQAVLAAARAAADAAGAPLVVVMFEPHPRRFFRPDLPAFRLTSLALRGALLERLGADAVVALPFDATMAARTPAQFVQEILCDGFQAKGAVVGYDFHFGKARAGTAQTLRELGEAANIQVHILDAVTQPSSNGGGEAYASTAVRAALRAGEMQQAAAGLGRWWCVEGEVQRGEQRGRLLGAPTANIPLADYLRPAFGIYTIAAKRAAHPQAPPLLGAASIGVRPQYPLDEPLLEAHFLDFDGDLYGETLAVALLARQRGEQKFASEAELKTQMQADIARARQDAPATLAAYPFLP